MRISSLRQLKLLENFRTKLLGGWITLSTGQIAIQYFAIHRMEIYSVHSVIRP